MKLSEHVDTIRELIQAAFDKQFARLGISASKLIEAEKLPEAMQAKRPRFEAMLKNHIGETGCYKAARAKLIDELTFTLFNRLAAIKVMEAAALFPPVLTKQAEQGGRSFGHKAWLELNSDMREEELEGIRDYIKHAFNELGDTLPLYGKDYPYALLPDAISLNEIIDAFNAVEKDTQVDDDIWQSDDVLGWTYESYNNQKKLAHKESKQKTEYNKVSLQSQVYTPRWVVQFLVENSLGKLYLEMYPGSEIKQHYKIANAPAAQEREPKPIHEIKIIDPACGSGNFLLYAFDFFYALYLDQIENYGADYEERDIPKLIIEHNLHGIDLDDRAIQIAQLGLFIKAKKKSRNIGELQFRVVSSDFYLPDYAEVEHIFSEGTKLDQNQRELIQDVWTDLQFAYKFGSLIRLDQKVKAKIHRLVDERNRESGKSELFSNADLGLAPELVQPDIFTERDIEQEEIFISQFFKQLKAAVEQYAQAEGNTFLSSKTRDAITFLELLTTEYDIATANPPYTDSGDFGPDLKSFIEANYKKPNKCHTNLYATFIKRCCDLTNTNGFIAMLHPLTFMYIKSFEGVRKFLLNNSNINILVELGLGGVFANSDVQVDVCMYVLEKEATSQTGVYFDLKAYKNHTAKPNIFSHAYSNYLNTGTDVHTYEIESSKLKVIKTWPFIYWISESFRETFGKTRSISDFFEVNEGLKTSNNIKYLRFFWEIDSTLISNETYKTIYKGGGYNKWHGNLWLVIALEKQRENLTRESSSSFSGEKNYKRKGIVCPNVGSKGTSFRSNSGSIFSNKDLGIYSKPNIHIPLNYALGYLNSSLVKYINEMLNPTVSITVGDINRIPFTTASPLVEKEIVQLVDSNIQTKKFLNKSSLLELDYEKSPIEESDSTLGIESRIKGHITQSIYLSALILLSEKTIDDYIYEIMRMSDADVAMVRRHPKIGKSVAALPVTIEARNAFKHEFGINQKFHKDDVIKNLDNLNEWGDSSESQAEIENDFNVLFRGKSDLESFCIRHQINPINVWFWFKQSNEIPQQRMRTLAMEFLADMVRDILMEDEDGVIPLVPNAGETILLDRIEAKFSEKGFSSAQYSSFDSVLGRPIKDYLKQHFFAELSAHLKLFKQLPATPFIWHLSSGPEQGFDCYIIIYKWSRDKLMRIRSVYIEQRERSLQNRQSDLAGNESADAQNEKERIFNQLKEIEAFKIKIDELLAEGYDPILDDGVGKNIAPLQKKGMIPYEVLNPGQLKKYLNADW
jgi:hypothetical protein